jgi:curved DNA-binding protein CbpA
MSGAAAGKFQDHYSLLGIETNADSDTIQAAYTQLAAKYRTDESKLAAINQAFEVLSDAELRAAFDKVKGVDHEAESPKFAGAEFFEALERSAGLRAAVLSILYDRRRIKSFKPSLSMRHLEGMLQVTGEALNFALWYLKKRKYVVNDDKSNMEITVEGMDFLEQNRPSAEVVMPFLKEAALVNPVLKVVTGIKLTEPVVPEPVLNVLSRAIQRSSATEEVKPQPRVTLQF